MNGWFKSCNCYWFSSASECKHMPDQSTLVLYELCFCGHWLVVVHGKGFSRSNFFACPHTLKIPARKYPYPHHRRLFSLHPLTPLDFLFQGVVNDPPQEFPIFLNKEFSNPWDKTNGFVVKKIKRKKLQCFSYKVTRNGTNLLFCQCFSHHSSTLANHAGLGIVGKVSSCSII